MKFWTVIIIVVLLVIGGASYAIYTAVQTTTISQTPSVRVEKAKRGDLSEIIAVAGQIEPRNKVSISSRVAAKIEKLPVKEGDRVTAGDPAKGIPASVLAILDATELEASLKQAKARRSAEEVGIQVAKERLVASESQIESTRITLKDAQRDLGRQQGLLTTHDVAQSVVDAAQVKVDGLIKQLAAAEANLRADRGNIGVLDHTLEAADAEIKRASDALAYTTILSPIDGVVTRINTKVGEVVVMGTMNNGGTVLMEVADLSQMLMEARVDEFSISRVKPGQPAVVHIQAFPNEKFPGIVETVAMSLTNDNTGSKYFKAQILLKDSARNVLAGLTADAEIEAQKHLNVLKAPSQSVLGKNLDSLPAALRDLPAIDKSKTIVPVVFRIVDGKAKLTPVKIGPSDDTHTIIETGLNEGDAVVAGPFRALEAMTDDQLVTVESPTTQPATQPAPTK